MIRTATKNDAEAFASVIVAAQATWVSWAGESFQSYATGRLTEQWSSRLTYPATLAFVTCGRQGKVVAVKEDTKESADATTRLIIVLVVGLVLLAIATGNAG